MLLPWRVNGTLEPAEADWFDAHLAECAECRADLAANLALRDQVAGLPAELPTGRTRVFDRLEAARPRSAPVWGLFRRRIALGWALAGQTAFAAVAVALFLAVSGDRPEAGYELLGSASETAQGNVIVLFAPDTAERDIRAALGSAGGRLVDGPTASGAWMVRVPDIERGAAIERLRGMPQVILAEPIDARDSP